MFSAIVHELVKLKDADSVTSDNVKITLSANIESPLEAESVISHGADGIGLYRTEYLYMNRTDLPSEEEQFLAYKQVASVLNPKEVVIRTLDLGGDKFLSAVDMPQEMNPFLGWRAIRFCLARVDVFKEQLRAILRASAFGNLKIMYPMIATLDELQRANELLEESKVELREKGIEFDEDIIVGAMIETPAAAIISDILADEVGFFSIGTNDLIQYSLAVDRVNERIAYLYDPTSPAIIRLVKDVIDKAHAKNIWVGMCGEMAGDPLFAILLVGLGIDKLSTSPVIVPKVKKAIRAIDSARSKQIAEHCLSLKKSSDVRAFLNSTLTEEFPDVFTN